MLTAGLIGDPVEHSLSPIMHNAAFIALGIDARYDLWPTSLASLAERVATLRGAEYLGANVTVPHKQAVMPLVDQLSDTAHRIGAVNTLIPRDGRLVGDNTDAYGFACSLTEARGYRHLERAVVVGAGGASRAVLVSLQDAGVGQVTLVNRTQAKAQALADVLGDSDRDPIRVVPWSSLGEVTRDADLVVNATSIGWHGDEMPFEAGIVDRWPDRAVVMDLTYRSTALLRRADMRGLRTVDGLPMLIHQGARSFELWTGQVAPVKVMTAAVLSEQARRA